MQLQSTQPGYNNLSPFIPWRSQVLAPIGNRISFLGTLNPDPKIEKKDCLRVLQRRHYAVSSGDQALAFFRPSLATIVVNPSGVTK